MVNNTSLLPPYIDRVRERQSVRQFLPTSSTTTALYIALSINPLKLHGSFCRIVLLIRVWPAAIDE